ncbi:copper transporter [Nocardia wallacei]|uniref:copper transporter n=1 Tax=Nocardia wallacei TaxID=480035 RepID=UPI003CC7F791
MAKKVRDPADPGPDVSLYLIYIGFAIVGIVWLALHLGNHMSVTKQDIPINPIAIVAGLARGQFEWAGRATGVLVFTTPDADAADVEAVTKGLTTAGAVVGGTVALTDAFVDSGQATGCARRSPT